MTCHDLGIPWRRQRRIVRIELLTLAAVDRYVYVFASPMTTGMHPAGESADSPQNV